MTHFLALIQKQLMPVLFLALAELHLLGVHDLHIIQAPLGVGGGVCDLLLQGGDFGVLFLQLLPKGIQLAELIRHVQGLGNGVQRVALEGGRVGPGGKQALHRGNGNGAAQALGLIRDALAAPAQLLLFLP